MQIAKTPGKFLSSIIIVAISIFVFQACEKTDAPSANDEIGGKKGRGNPHTPPPPPPPPPFYFTNCIYPNVSGNINAGLPTSVTFTMTYINSPGGSYPAYTSATLGGITLTAPAGVLNVGSGSVVLTASGTPTTPGLYQFPFSIGGSFSCNIYVTVLNEILTGPCSDPGPTVGSTGCVTFTYKGQTVTYKTVRAGDGKIWIQQNLGSPQVALTHYDAASMGDYFQWGRWDDGHQTKNSSTLTGSAGLQNPSHIPNGNPNFIAGATATTAWWGTGGLPTDTWSGMIATSTNGKDPCAALGPGWHMPSSAEWNQVSFAEDLFGAMAAFSSRLLLPEAGFRDRGGYLFGPGGGSYYWSSTAVSGTTANFFFTDDNTYDVFISPTDRGYGFPCRCLK